MLSRREAAQARTNATSTHTPLGQEEHRIWPPSEPLLDWGSLHRAVPSHLLGEHCRGTGLPRSWCHTQFLSAQSRQVRCESLPASPCDLGPKTLGGSQTISQHPEQAALCHSPAWCNSGAAAGRAVLGGQVLACPSEAWGSPAMQCWVPGLCHLQQLLAGALCTAWLGGKVLSFPG